MFIELAREHLLAVLVIGANLAFSASTAIGATVLAVEVPDGVVIALFVSALSFGSWIVLMLMKVTGDQRETAVIVREMSKDIDHLHQRLESGGH